MPAPACHKQSCKRLLLLVCAPFVLFAYFFCPRYLVRWGSTQERPINVTLNLAGASFHSRVLPWRSSTELPRLLSLKDHDTSIALLRLVDQLLRQNNVTYVLAYGNLIGSYVMHDILPWDDDLDILVRLADQSKLERIFQADSPHPIRSLYYHNGMTQTLKLFFEDSPFAGMRSWRWPFVDVAFFGENVTSVWNMDYFPLVLDREAFYPLHRRPLASLWLPSPRDTGLFLRVKYGQLKCSTHPWNHRWEVPTWRVYNTPCQNLKKFYPFVHRERLGQDKVKETLLFDSRPLYSVTIDEPYAEEEGFSFEELH